MNLKADYDLVVIGGGAAGTFAAIQAASANPALRILILEKSNQLLAKVRISGGGRCNLSNGTEPLSTFSAQYPRGARHVLQLLHRFSPVDTYQWFENHGVALKTEHDLRIFPQSDRSESVVNCLVNELMRLKITVRMKSAVQLVNPLPTGFQIQTDNDTLISKNLLIACGGAPGLASWQWIKPLDLEIVPPVPSLFTFNIPNHPAKHLMGLSALCRIRVEGSKLEETGNLLITHWGFSGPAVLRCSAWGARWLAEKQYQFALRIHWLPEKQQDEIRTFLEHCKVVATKKNVHTKVFTELPQRLWAYLCERAGIGVACLWGDISKKQLNKLAEVISADEYKVSGKTTFKEEFVTCGGIALSEINSQTCMAKKHQGLFFAGEILDVDGITGGFNFQHAWSSGFVAGHSIAALLSKWA